MLAFFFLLFMGCSKKNKPAPIFPVIPSGIPSAIVEGHTAVFMPADTTEDEHVEYIESIQAHINAFKKNNSNIWYQTTIVVREERNSFDYKGLKNRGGAYDPAINTIFVTKGAYNELPILYHEIGHLTYPGHDPFHDFADWETIEKDGFVVSQMLRKQRSVSQQTLAIYNSEHIKRLSLKLWR